MVISYNLFDIWLSLTFNYSYNVSIVSLALIAQGLATGLLGGLLLYRRKSLLADALSHSTLPGVAAGFFVSYFFMGGNRVEWVILMGAFIMMLVCLATINLLTRHITQDAALSITLSGFYAAGIVMLSYIQVIPSGVKAGLEYFILGQSATINMIEATLISGGALVVFCVYALLYKEWKLLCFDQSYARARGYNTAFLDFVITILSCVVIAIGIRAMGLILIMGLITIPALAASLVIKTWGKFLMTSALVAALAAHIGSSISAGMDGIPTGSAVIIVCMLFYIGFLAFRYFTRSVAGNNESAVDSVS